MVTEASIPDVVSVCSVSGKARVKLFTSLTSRTRETSPVGFDFRKVGKHYVLTGFNLPDQGVLEVVLPVPAEQLTPARQ